MWFSGQLFKENEIEEAILETILHINFEETLFSFNNDYKKSASLIRKNLTILDCCFGCVYSEIFPF